MTDGVGHAVGSAVLRPSDAAEMPLVCIEDVSVRYALPRRFLSRTPRSLLAVDRVSLSIARGETLGIVGATGSGKSTLARVVMGMQSPTSGSAIVAGHDVSKVKGEDRRALQHLRQVVLQDPYSSLNPRAKVADIVAEPLRHDPETRGLTRSERRGRVAELLSLVGLPASRADFYPHQFSGGQRQRISIARALASNPQLIVLDEPTSALDVSVRAQILKLLRDLQDRLGVTYMIISHDLVTVAFLASTVAVMDRGRVVELGPTASIYRQARHPYTIELLASTPSVGGAFLNLPQRPEDRQDALPATACPFASRCGLRERRGNPVRCVEEPPELTENEHGHFAACHYSGAVTELAADVGIDLDE